MAGNLIADVLALIANAENLLRRLSKGAASGVFTDNDTEQNKLPFRLGGENVKN